MDSKPTEYFPIDEMPPTHESSVRNEPCKVFPISHMLILNIPWFSVVVVYIVTVLYLNPTTWEWLISSGGSRDAVRFCGAPFICIYCFVGFLTYIMNRFFFICYKDQRGQSGSEQKRGLQLIWAFVLIFMVCVSLFCFVGVVWRWAQWAFISVTCREEGYPTTILLKVNTGNQALNTATIQTEYGTPDLLFGLTLLPTINATDVSRTDFQLSTSLNLTTPGLGDRLRDDRLLIQLADKTYEWGYTGSGVEARRGYFTEGPEGISFPSLNPPLRTKGTWAPGERPAVEWVKDGSSEVVLKTAGYRLSFTPCNELRMCAEWDLKDLVLRPEQMEALMAPLARTMVEMAKYGMAYC